MREEAQYSILQNKFRDWFEDPVSGDTLSPDSNHSNEEPAQVDSLFPAQANQPNLKRRRTIRTQKKRKVNSTRLMELLFFGVMGAIALGAGARIVMYFMELNFGGWYSIGWPSQFSVILIAAVLGFNIGLANGYYTSQKRQKYF